MTDSNPTLTMALGEPEGTLRPQQPPTTSRKLRLFKD